MDLPVVPRHLCERADYWRPLDDWFYYTVSIRQFWILISPPTSFLGTSGTYSWVHLIGPVFFSVLYPTLLSWPVAGLETDLTVVPQAESIRFASSIHSTYIYRVYTCGD
jgi:hypothetical protein